LCLYERRTQIGQSEELHALPAAELYRRLLGIYSLSVIDDTVRWLEVGQFLGRSGIGINGPYAHMLTPKGVTFAKSQSLPLADRALLYTEDPYSVFVARQFRAQDDTLFEVLAKDVPRSGFAIHDGRVDGLDAFRGEILRKIRKARFFLCLLTHRAEIKGGGFASSVWLYQETGAAVALGKKPLILVEEGMHEHYAGEMQKSYEYITFSRPDFSSVIPEVVRRLHGDLTANHIPLPREKDG
jgi:hypothetical protein